MSARIAARIAFFVLFSCFAFRSGAQTKAPAPDEFGTQDGIDLWIPAVQFVGGSAVLDGGPGYFFNSTTQLKYLYAPVALPQGAFLDSWRAFFLDNSPTNNITVGLIKVFDDINNPPSPTNVELSQFESSGTPGYNNHHQVENVTIDLREPSGPGVTRMQAADFYEFWVAMPADTDVAFEGVRVFWHRQVSPAPATATFNDVPTTDPGFQYIEALVASGITAGCSAAPPMYCPDATLTRRQMAVFLSKALGLHWPPF